MKKYKATDPEMVQAQKDLAKMSNLSDRVITNEISICSKASFNRSFNFSNGCI